MMNALQRIPALETAEVRMLLNGPESFTPDGLFLLGEAPELSGFFLGCGMNSVGVASGGGAGRAQEVARDVGGVKFAARRLDHVPAKELKAMADALKESMGSGVAALITVGDGKASLVVGVTKDLTQRLDAVELVRIGARVLGGKGGGGRPEMAQAGGPAGPNGAKAAAALEAIERAIAGKAKG